MSWGRLGRLAVRSTGSESFACLCDMRMSVLGTRPLGGIPWVLRSSKSYKSRRVLRTRHDGHDEATRLWFGQAGRQRPFGVNCGLSAATGKPSQWWREWSCACSLVGSRAIGWRPRSAAGAGQAVSPVPRVLPRVMVGPLQVQRGQPFLISPLAGTLECPGFRIPAAGRHNIPLGDGVMTVDSRRSPCDPTRRIAARLRRV